jgi:hypothetical protein
MTDGACFLRRDIHIIEQRRAWLLKEQCRQRCQHAILPCKAQALQHDGCTLQGCAVLNMDGGMKTGWAGVGVRGWRVIALKTWKASNWIERDESLSRIIMSLRLSGSVTYFIMILVLVRSNSSSPNSCIHRVLGRRNCLGC